TLSSSGVNVGFNAEQTVAPGQTRTYWFYADTAKLQSALISDFGGQEGSRDGLYGAVIVAPTGATFTNPVTGAKTDVGSQVDVHVPAAGTTPASSYRDFSLLLADQDPTIGQRATPSPRDVSGPALVHHRNADPDHRRQPGASYFSSAVNGDPQTPILQAYAGDPLVVHVINAPGSEQLHTISLGGLSWPVDP